MLDEKHSLDPVVGVAITRLVDADTPRFSVSQELITSMWTHESRNQASCSLEPSH